MKPLIGYRDYLKLEVEKAFPCYVISEQFTADEPGPANRYMAVVSIPEPGLIQGILDPGQLVETLSSHHDIDGISVSQSEAEAAGAYKFEAELIED